MPQSQTLAERIIAGDATAAAGLEGIIRLQSNNLIERPWGGLAMLEYKGCAALPDQKKITGLGLGEAFEMAACPADPESNAHPSFIRLPDGSRIELPALLKQIGPAVLGQKLHQQFAGDIPLLPKTLDIEELLSVQAHPPGNTELYVIIDAEPGATIRLGFRQDIDRELLRVLLKAGRQRQEDLLAQLSGEVNQHRLHEILIPFFSQRRNDLSKLKPLLQPLIVANADLAGVLDIVQQLKSDYWQVLDLMNEVAVRPGQIIYNATPARICAATGNAPTAEVHALGNPERREILMLEIRRPGVTYRAWDNVRFPIRDINIDQTLSALSLRATAATEFEVAVEALPDSPGLFRSVASDSFIVDHIRPEKNLPVSITGGYFHTLHAIRGCVTLTDDAGNQTVLGSGESAIAPATLSAYRVTSDAAAELIRVSLPAT